MNARNTSDVAEMRVSAGHAYQQVTISTTALSVTPITACRYVYWTVEANDVRVREDGTAPDADTGHKIVSGSSGTWERSRFEKAKWIRVSADAKLSITELG